MSFSQSDSIVVEAACVGQGTAEALEHGKGGLEAVGQNPSKSRQGGWTRQWIQIWIHCLDFVSRRRAVGPGSSRTTLAIHEAIITHSMIPFIWEMSAIRNLPGIAYRMHVV